MPRRISLKKHISLSPWWEWKATGCRTGDAINRAWSSLPWTLVFRPVLSSQSIACTCQSRCIYSSNRARIVCSGLGCPRRNSRRKSRNNQAWFLLLCRCGNCNSFASNRRGAGGACGPGLWPFGRSTMRRGRSGSRGGWPRTSGLDKLRPHVQ